MVRVALLLLMWIAALVPSVAHAEKRVALVIGNSAYTKVAKLINPTNDADAVAMLFRTAGFDLIEVTRDLGLSAMRSALRKFSDHAADADIAVVFFAGHGIEVNGTNYLIPVDAALERDIDVEDETISLDRVTQLLERTKRLRLVILDACRDNPFVRSMKRTATSRSIGRGLAKVEVVASDTLIAFAAKHGSTAEDGKGTNSPYTKALVKHLATPGLDLRIAFGRVRDEVLQSTANRQEPHHYGSLGGSQIALVAASKVQDSEPQSTQKMPSSSSPSREWAFLDKTNTVELETFVRRHAGSAEADYARARIAALKKQEDDRRSAKVKQEPTGAATRTWRTREAVRETLYQTIMSGLSQRISSSGDGESVTENYREHRRPPKALAVCIDWKTTTPTQLNPGQSNASYRKTADSGCRGFTPQKCGQLVQRACEGRGTCQMRGQRCVLVDVNGRNAISLDEAWVSKFVR